MLPLIRLIMFLCCIVSLLNLASREAAVAAEGQELERERLQANPSTFAVIEINHNLDAVGIAGTGLFYNDATGTLTGLEVSNLPTSFWTHNSGAKSDVFPGVLWFRADVQLVEADPLAVNLFLPGRQIDEFELYKQEFFALTDGTGGNWRPPYLVSSSGTKLGWLDWRARLTGGRALLQPGLPSRLFVRMRNASSWVPQISIADDRGLAAFEMPRSILFGFGIGSLVGLGLVSMVLFVFATRSVAARAIAAGYLVFLLASIVFVIWSSGHLDLLQIVSDSSTVLSKSDLEGAVAAFVCFSAALLIFVSLKCLGAGHRWCLVGGGVSFFCGCLALLNENMGALVSPGVLLPASYGSAFLGVVALLVRGPNRQQPRAGAIGAGWFLLFVFALFGDGTLARLPGAAAMLLEAMDVLQLLGLFFLWIGVFWESARRSPQL